MERNRKKLILLCLLGPVIGLFLYTNHLTNGQLEERAFGNSYDPLEEDYEHIKEEIAMFHDGSLDSLPSYEDNKHAWENAEQLGDFLHEESEGHFEERWGMYLGLIAEQEDVDPFLVYELLKVESGDTFDEHAVGPETKYGHAYGMAQFMTNTAPWIADMASLDYEKDYLFNPYYAIHLSVQYLSFLHDQYDNWDQALTAYHRGMGGMQAYITENGHAKSEYAVTIQKQAKTHDLF